MNFVIDELQREAIDGTVDLSGLPRNALLIATKLMLADAPAVDGHNNREL